MPGFYSYVLEQRITFDASPINLAGSTADWTPVQSSDNHDPKNDSQSTRGETDLVGDGTHTLLYAKYDTKDTATESDDEIGFRLRIGATDASGGFGSLGAIGVDANNDGVVDLFLAYDGRATPTVSLFEPGPGGNDTPASTSLQNAVVAAGAETDISLVDATTDPTATDTDLNDDGSTDAFVSFKFLFSSLKDQMSSVSGISLSKDSALQFATFTLTQENAIDGDIGGISGGNDSTATHSDLGVFSKSVTPDELTDTTPAPTPTANPIITSNGGGSVGFPVLFENTASVTTVTASDSDGDTVTFSIVGGNDQDLFQVDSASGALSFKVAPDFENPTGVLGNRYAVIVGANDGQGGSDTQTLRITILNAQEPSEITSGGGGDTATVDAAENATVATTVTANDDDGDAITFALAGGADENLFEIDAATGVLVFKTAPDFETPGDNDRNNEYVVAVQASSTGGSDTQTLTVRVTNANDAPAITSDGGGDDADVNVLEETTAVTTVTANDVDGDTVSFEIAGGDDAVLFQINRTSGVLTFTTAPDFESPGDAGGDNDYVVIVRANDGAGGADTQAITVSVTKADETVATAPDIPPVLPVSGGNPAPGGGTETGAGTETNEGSGTDLVTGADSSVPAPPAFDLSPPPAPDAEAPAAPDTPPPESAAENLSEAAAEALAEAAAASLANLAPAAGSSDTETVREQTASVETQTRETQETQQSPPEQGPNLILDAGIPDIVFEADSSFTFRLPDNVFAIVGANATTGVLSELAMEAALADGSPLPEWLIFDPLLKEFRGTPPEGGDLTFEIRVTATDLEGTEAAATFQMLVEPAGSETEQGKQGISAGNQQSSLESGDVLTAPTIESENGERLQSTGNVVPQISADAVAKPSLTGQIQETGFGKFQADALRLALGRSG